MEFECKGQELPFSIYTQIEKVLTDSDEVNADVLDSFQLEYPDSKYLIGMRIYLECLDGNLVSAKEFIERKAIVDGEYLDNTYTLLGVGMYFLKLDKLDSSLIFFQRSRELDLEFRNKWVRLELYYLTMNSNRKLALSMLKEALELDKNFYLALVEYVAELAKDSLYQTAISQINSFESFENDAHLCYLIGFCYLNIEDYSNAEKWFQVSFEIKESVEALVGLGYLHQYIHNNPRKALENYQKAFAIEPENPTVNKRLGLYYKEFEEFELAEKHLEKAIQVINTKEDYYSLIHVYVNLNKYKEAMKLNELSTMELGFDRVNEFWSILISSLKGDILTAQKYLDEYYLVYGTEDIDWLKKALQVWNVDITKR